MKKTINSLLFAAILSTMPTLAHAMFSCSAGPCSDGSSCSVTGSTYANCSCVSTGIPGDTWAKCTSGLVVGLDGKVPEVERGFIATPISGFEVFVITK